MMTVQLLLAGIVIVAGWNCYSYFRHAARQVTKAQLRISEIYVYPIKGLRASKVDEAVATKSGFEYDRRYMLLQVTPDGCKNMSVSRYPEMTRFLTTIIEENKQMVCKVTYTSATDAKDTRTITIPLNPSTEKLSPHDIDMHNSPTEAFKMPDIHNTWFSSCFGYSVILIFLGPHHRTSLFQDVAPRRATLISRLLRTPSTPSTDHLTFADCAPYLVVSATSLDSVSARLPPTTPMDVTKFRPNVVLSGAPSPWEEDYWRRLRIPRTATDIVLMHNCVRCSSINVDYATGKPGTGPEGNVLKRLQGDRRVDRGAKWSPVFGRYGFWGGGGVGMVKVGDEVGVVEVNGERTVWNWPGLA